MRQQSRRDQGRLWRGGGYGGRGGLLFGGVCFLGGGVLWVVVVLGGWGGVVFATALPINTSPHN